MDNSTAKVDPSCLEAAGVLFDLGAAVTPPDDARAGSTARFRRAEREQIVMRNVALDDLLPKDHGARVLWQYVEGLDLTPLYRKILAVEGGKGRTPADPRILFALWLYASVEGVGSARGLARLCEEHVAYQWLAGDVPMNYHTLADFRTGHPEFLDGLLTRSVATLMEQELVDLNRVAQDGMQRRQREGASGGRKC